jgi:hypothetical protein
MASAVALLAKASKIEDGLEDTVAIHGVRNSGVHRILIKS